MTLDDDAVEKAPTITQVSSEDEDACCRSDTTFVSEDTKKTLQRVRMSLSAAKNQFQYLKTQQLLSGDLENKNDDAVEKKFEKNIISEESGDGPSKTNKSHNGELQYTPTYEVYVINEVSQNSALISEETNDNPVRIRSELKWAKEIINNLQTVNQQMTARLTTVEQERDGFREQFEKTTETCNTVVEELKQCQAKIELLETELHMMKKKRALHKHNSNHFLKSCPDKKDLAQYFKTTTSIEECKINESNALLAENEELTNSNVNHTHTNTSDNISVCPLNNCGEKITIGDKMDTSRTFLKKNSNNKMINKESESGIHIMHSTCCGDEEKIKFQMKNSESNNELITYNQNIEALHMKRRKISPCSSSRKNSSMHQTEVFKNRCEKSFKKCLKSEALSELDAKIGGIFNPFKILIQIPVNTPDIKIQHLSIKKSSTVCNKNNMKTLIVEIRNPTDLRRLVSQVPQVKDYLRQKFNKREHDKKCGVYYNNVDRKRSGDWKHRVSRGEEYDTQNKRILQSTDSSFISIPEYKLNTTFCQSLLSDVSTNKLAYGLLKSCLKTSDGSPFQNDPSLILHSLEEKKVVFDQNILVTPVSSKTHTENQKPETPALNSLKIRWC